LDRIEASGRIGLAADATDEAVKRHFGAPSLVATFDSQLS